MGRGRILHIPGRGSSLCQRPAGQYCHQGGVHRPPIVDVLLGDRSAVVQRLVDGGGWEHDRGSRRGGCRGWWC